MTSRYQNLKNGTIPLLRLSTNQVVAVAVASARSTNAVGIAVRVVCTSACHIRFGPGSPTALTTDPLLPANTVEYFALADDGLDKIAAIRTSADGTLSVTTVE